MARAATLTQRPPQAQSRPTDKEPTSVLPSAILGGGILALVLTLGGLIGVQVYYSIAGGDVTRYCLDHNLNPETITGALGVCHVAEAFRSDALAGVEFAGIAVGLVAIACGFGLYKRMPNKRQREQTITGGVLGIQAIVVALFLLWFRAGDVAIFSRSFFNFFILGGYGEQFARGIWNTVRLAFVGELGGITIGLILAILVLSKRRAVRAPAVAYINFFRGTPLIWQLMFFYFGIVIGLNLDLKTLTIAMLVFALNTGAYAAEVFRAGIQSIERGQFEAARSLGMTYMQSMRYAIVPQAVRRVIPPLMNEFVILIKDTSLIIVLGLTLNESDILSVANQGYSTTFNATFFVAAAMAYLAVTLPLIGIVNVVERRLRSGLTGIVGGA